MSVSEIDIWRTANVLVKQHGEDATIIASQRADELLERGDLDGQRVWVAILRAVRELQRSEPRQDERVN